MKKWLIETARLDARLLDTLITEQFKSSNGVYPPVSMLCSIKKLNLFINEVERVLKENDLYEM